MWCTEADHGEWRPVNTAQELHSVAVECQPSIVLIWCRIADALGLEIFDNLDDLTASGMVGLLLGPTKKLEDIVKKAKKNADAKHPFAKIIDVVRCRFVCQQAVHMRQILDLLEAEPGVRIVRFKNFFAEKDEINFRRFAATVEFEISPTLRHVAEVQIQLRDIYVFRQTREDLAYYP